MFLLFLLLSSCEKEAIIEEKSIIGTNVDITLRSHKEGHQDSRAFIIRADWQSLYGFPVPEKDITLIIGGSYREICDGNFENLDVFKRKLVVKNEDDDYPRYHDLAKGENVLLEIWPFADMSFSMDCDQYFDKDPIFSGRVDIHATDNDLIPFDQDKNINSFGFVASSNEIHVVYRGAWDGLNEDTWVTRACRIRYL